MTNLSKSLFCLTVFLLSYSSAKSYSSTQGADSTITVKPKDYSSSEYFILSSKTDAPSYEQGKTIFLSISIKNIGQETVSVSVGSNLLAIYKISVVDSQGKEVDLTKYGKELISRKASVYHYDSVDLKPGEERVDSIYIGAMFDFSKPGKYRARTSRWMEKRNDHKALVRLDSDSAEFIIKDIKKG